MNRKNSSKISYKIYHTHLIVRENVSAKIKWIRSPEMDETVGKNHKQTLTNRIEEE